jgi:putative transposase
VRNALAHVLSNWKKHGAVSRPLDWCSSAPWFDGWAKRRTAAPASLPCPVAAPQTWLLRVGWKRHGLLSPDESPRGLQVVPSAPAGRAGAVRRGREGR